MERNVGERNVPCKEMHECCLGIASGIYIFGQYVRAYG